LRISYSPTREGAGDWGIWWGKVDKNFLHGRGCTGKRKIFKPYYWEGGLKSGGLITGISRNGKPGTGYRVEVSL